jgi:hypothetical protein
LEVTENVKCVIESSRDDEAADYRRLLFSTWERRGKGCVG